MKPEETMEIPAPRYREQLEYWDEEGHRYVLTDTNYNISDEGWKYYCSHNGKTFGEHELDKWIPETERERVHREQDEAIREWHRKWIENRNRQQVMKEALR